MRPTSLGFMALALLAALNVSNGQTNFWEHTNGPYGPAWITALSKDSSGGIYLGTYGTGVYKSTDGGSSWNHAGFELADIISLATLRGGAVFAGTNAEGWKSTDGGASWASTSAPSGIRLMIVAKSGRIIANALDAIWTSDDNATTWVRRAELPGWVYAVALYATARGTVLASFTDAWTQPVLHPTGLYRSTDEGVTWSNTGMSFTASSFAEDGVGNVLAFSGIFPSVFASSDDGQHWSPLSSSDIRDTYWSTTTPTGDVIAGTIRSGIWKSTDHGISWTFLNSCNVTALLITDEGFILQGDSRNGVFRSTDGGATWNRRSAGINGGKIQAVLGVDARQVLCSLSSTFYKSTDEGQTWEAVVVDRANPGINILHRSLEGEIYAFGARLFKSTDAGISWLPSVPLPAGPFSVCGLGAGRPGTLLIGTVNGVYRTTDDGNSWVALNNGITDLYVFSVTCSRQGTLLAGGQDGQIYRSTNNGDLWTESTILAPGIGKIRCLSTLPTGEILAGSDHIGIFKSTDDGKTWSLSLDLVWAGIYSISQDRFGIPYAAGYADRVYRSLDQGQSWETVSSAITSYPGVQIASLDISPSGRLYVGTVYAGLYRSVGLLSAAGGLGPAPMQFELSQNYPNPFNPSTTIRFVLPKTAHVSLNISNVLGQVVATLVNEERGPGFYDVKWNAAVPSGVYFYRLQAGDFTEAKKMILLR